MKELQITAVIFLLVAVPAVLLSALESDADWIFNPYKKK